MRSRALLSVSVVLAAGAFLVPSVTHAAIPFFGHIIPDAHNTCAAGWGMLIIVINNIIQFAITIAIVFIAPIMIAWAGFLFVVSPTNPSHRSQAKSILWNTVIGIVIALVGWLLVDAIMVTLTGQGLDVWTNLVGTNNVQPCLNIPTTLQQTTGGGTITGMSLLGQFTSGGTCTPLSSGPCSVQSLSNTCFNPNQLNAAKVCSRESTGNTFKLSSTDKLADGNSYSVGLFQINLTNSYTIPVDGQSCSNAFTQPCQNSGGHHNVSPTGACSSTIKSGSCGSVSCMQLYTDCVQSAKNPSNNISVACQLSSNGTNWSRWRNTAQACGI